MEENKDQYDIIHCEKSVRIRSFISLYSVRMRTGKIPNTDTLHAVIINHISLIYKHYV